MPTTLTGLLLFVVLLLPGFAYLVGKERHGTERRLSPFRETVAIVSASVTSELVVLGIFAAIRALWPSVTPNVGAMLRQGDYTFTATKAIMATIRCSLHGGLGCSSWPCVLHIRLLSLAYDVFFEWLTGPYPHESTVSAWWMLFEKWRKAPAKQRSAVFLMTVHQSAGNLGHSISPQMIHLIEISY